MTRSTEQAGELVARLEALGAHALRCPTLAFAEAPAGGALDEALRGLASYAWLVVTSPNGARFLARSLERLGLLPAPPPGCRVAAVGPATAAALAEAGIPTDWMPGEHTGRALAEGLEPVAGLRVLLARGDLADTEPARILAERGADPTEVVTYRTLPAAPPPEAMEELRRGVDAVTFTSPSTVEGLRGIGPGWRDLLEGAAVATIGSTTTRAARRAGLEVHAEARERTMEGLVQAVVRALASRAAPPAPEVRP
ncbi:MAG TPA: uroporphyrinogen-III synthase [Longimicrobiales bacterium]|nr:uroporphyrinogen-III synthase [Longimicrobiales bacterium]